MKHFFDVLGSEESIFKNEEVLNFDYLPNRLPGREKEINEIVYAIKPLFQQRSAINLFIFGNPGIGKTACVKYVFDKLEEESDDIIPIYINCWENTTNHSIMSKISEHLAIPFPKKGVALEVVIREMHERLKKIGAYVFAFDEVDKVETPDFLYTLFENFHRNACFILITNHRDFVLKIDPRIKSRLQLNNLEFKQYKMDEIEEILRQRIKLAFVPGAVPEEVIKLCVEKTYENGDIRTGLFILLKAGKMAESSASKKISIEHIKKVIETLPDFSKELMIEQLGNEERKILEIIKENPGKLSGEIFQLYKQKGGKTTDRSLRNYLLKLEKLGFIRMEETGEGFKGRSRRIYPK
ncbi:MAG: AAA family ATPase [Candidatus Parvarchaeota archaeon]|nr:AAA family ATPase [Candidatus Jingweiarchaeum tengchongense]MCW1297895.1 AAA family ATPase [Candidatus Jingweiarchaeum tengchongense]MCW1299906.1 AAA family ATPase [Candidatus Jingweiarchaeum tengchongense]MCW1305090.1 AAA family ATPase [Candidatus Jingweiarchaeum tengchongense]MCW1305152.1 AAA family ATPase [Candidatus Jingweiarchaeum tengchongense]